MKGSTISALVTIGAGCVGALLVGVLMVAGSANASPGVLALVSRMVSVLGASVVLSLVGGGAAIYFGRPFLAVGLGLLPVAACVVALVLLDRASG